MHLLIFILDRIQEVECFNVASKFYNLKLKGWRANADLTTKQYRRPTKPTVKLKRRKSLNVFILSNRSNKEINNYNYTSCKFSLFVLVTRNCGGCVKTLKKKT